MAKSHTAVERCCASTRAQNASGPHKAGRFFGSCVTLDQNVYFSVAIIDQRDTVRLGSRKPPS